jgi:hypothetical protein
MSKLNDRLNVFTTGQDTACAEIVGDFCRIFDGTKKFDTLSLVESLFPFVH